MMRRATGLVALLVAVATLAPGIAPYDPARSFRAYLHAPPMSPEFASGGPVIHPLILADRLEQRFERDPTRTLRLPWFAGNEQSAPVFLLGADSLGRDVLSRLLFGARLSIGLALVATLGVLLIGGALGALAGLSGGWVDELVMRISDFVLVLPMLYVVLVLRAVLPLVLEPFTVFLIMSGIFIAVGWPFVAKGVRAIAIVERDREYVLAARSLGAGSTRVISRHLLPACASYMTTQATLLLPAFVLAEATLSFVGLGFPDAVPSWGTMLIEAADVGALSRFPWTLSPAFAILGVALTANLLAGGRGPDR